MKRRLDREEAREGIASSPAFCGGLIEATMSRGRLSNISVSSPAFCGGLIEATTRPGTSRSGCRRLPPRSAGASLKPHDLRERRHHPVRSSPAFCGGLIEAIRLRRRRPPGRRSSPAFCGGLIEASRGSAALRLRGRGLPPRSAGASLKLALPAPPVLHPRQSSPAFCGGLIEARCSAPRPTPSGPVFPRVLRGPH